MNKCSLNNSLDDEEEGVVDKIDDNIQIVARVGADKLAEVQEYFWDQ